MNACEVYTRVIMLFRTPNVYVHRAHDERNATGGLQTVSQHLRDMWSHALINIVDRIVEVKVTIIDSFDYFIQSRFT